MPKATKPKAADSIMGSLNTGELAKALGISSNTVRAMTLAGRIPFYEFGPRTRRYDLEEVRAALRHERAAS